MFAIGHDELEKKPALGDVVKCQACGKMHKVEYGEKVLPDGRREPSKLLAFVNCKETGKQFLVGIAGKQLFE